MEYHDNGFQSVFSKTIPGKKHHGEVCNCSHISMIYLQCINFFLLGLLRPRDRPARQDNTSGVWHQQYTRNHVWSLNRWLLVHGWLRLNRVSVIGDDFGHVRFFVLNDWPLSYVSVISNMICKLWGLLFVLGSIHHSQQHKAISGPAVRDWWQMRWVLVIACRLIQSMSSSKVAPHPHPNPPQPTLPPATNPRPHPPTRHQPPPTHLPPTPNPTNPPATNPQPYTPTATHQPPTPPPPTHQPPTPTHPRTPHPPATTPTTHHQPATTTTTTHKANRLTEMSTFSAI